MQEGKKMDARAAIDKYLRQNPMRRRLGWDDHRIIHAFCPADSMHEVRGYEARSRCQAKEQHMSRAAEMSKMQ